jgi:hypothetical protein
MSVVTMNGVTKPDVIEISDTTKAAYLWCLGLRPIDVREQGRGSRQAFVFERVDPALIRAFDLDTARVSPMQFGAAYKSLVRLLRAS